MIEDLQDTYPGAGTFKLGEDAETSAALIALVRAKTKHAECAALAEFGGDEDSMPKVGRCDIIANWDGTPAVVIKTISVKTLPFDKVTERMALAEGEHETLAQWRNARQKHFKRSGGFKPDMPLVFEFFEVVENLVGSEIDPDEALR
ncbi:ASCH domain-containing protein [Profundibacter sp.]